MRRKVVVLAAVVLALASEAAWANPAPDFQAMARLRQGKSHGSELGSKGFVAEMSKAGQAWVAQETQRQIANPRAVLEVALDVDKALVKDARTFKQRYRVHPLDVTRAVALAIMKDAQVVAAEAVETARASGDATALAVAEERMTLANANLQAAEAVQSDASRALTAM